MSAENKRNFFIVNNGLMESQNILFENWPDTEKGTPDFPDG
jgi:hypothetical protein